MQTEDEVILPTMTAAEFDQRIVAANERRAVENAKMRQETHALEQLIERKLRLVARLEATLAEMQAEQETINAEVRRLLTPEEQAIFARIGKS
jgi:anti-sigma-K factor RskA